MPYVFVDPDEVLDDLSSAEVAAELIRRDDWSDAMKAALADKYADVDLEELIEEARRMIEDYRLGRAIDERVRKIAWTTGIMA